MYTEILQAVSEFLSVPIGQLPESGGIVMELAPTGSPRRFFGGQSYAQMSVLLLSKDKSQKNALSRLNDVCDKCRTLNLPHSENWEIKTIEIATMPNYVGTEKTKDGNMWIFSAIITVNFYDRRNF